MKERFNLLNLLCDRESCDLNAKNNNTLLIFKDNIHLTCKGSEAYRQYLTFGYQSF